MRTAKKMSIRFSAKASGVALAAAVAAAFLAPAAQAAPYVVTLTQQGSNVVASGSGALDLDGLDYYADGCASNCVGSTITPYISQLQIGLGGMSFYSGLTGPVNFGSGQQVFGAGTGDVAGVIGYPGWIGPYLLVPSGYVSDTPLTGGGTWDNATASSLGVTPGTYVWTWGSGPDQSFTIDAFTAVPEPGELGMFGFGLALLVVGAAVKGRKRLRAIG